MAKWGEGDPRWIVEERPDATNVNNWHWTEKNATPWSKDRFYHLFKNLIIASDNFKCTIESIEKCIGEATANNRKGKLIFFYEWELILKWKGQILNSKSIHYGKISISNLCEENEISDVEITVDVDGSNNEAEKLNQYMYDFGRSEIRKILGVYVTELKEEYSKNLILPKKEHIAGNNCEITSSLRFKKEVTETIIESELSSGCKFDVCTLSIEEEFQCSADDLYNTLTKASMVSAFTKSPAKVDANRGGQFNLYGGSVHGTFEELIPAKRIVLRWRLKTWPSGHFSNVLIELDERKNCTKLKLTQTDVPASEYDAIKANWYRYYWHSIKQTFGFGVTLENIL